MLAGLALALALSVPAQDVPPAVRAIDPTYTWNDEKAAPDALPEPVARALKDEAPDAKLEAAYTDENGWFKLVARKDPRTLAVLRVTDDGTLLAVDARTRLDPKAVPKAVAGALAKPGAVPESQADELKTFKPEHTDKVVQRAGLGGGGREPVAFFELVGRNEGGRRYRVGVDEAGKVLYTENVLPNPSANDTALAVADVPEPVRRGFLRAFASMKGAEVTAALESKSSDDGPSTFLVDGKTDKGRRLRAAVEPDGRLLWAAAQVSSKDVPKPVMGLLRDRMQSEAELKGFAPRLGMLVRNAALGSTAYAFFGKNAEGREQEVYVESDDLVLVRSPSDILPPGALDAPDAP
jgi:hypothetical protein